MNNTDALLLDEQYRIKYLKYKSKYLVLKNSRSMIGGGDKNTTEIALYKANWCGHCKMFLPVWEKLQNNYTNDKIKFTTYDSELHKDIIEQNNIQGFPTIHIMKGGSIQEYNGDRTYEVLVETINNLLNN